MTLSASLLAASCLAGLLALATGAGAATSLVIDAGARGGTGASSAADDHVRIVRNGETLEVYLGGTLSRSIDFASLGSLTVNGSDDDDTLTVDFAGGNPIPPGGLAYHGGANVTRTGDTLRLANGTVVAMAYRFFNPTDGTIDVDGRTITFTGLEPVVDLVAAASLVVSGTGAPNAITYRTGSSADRGLVAVDNFETVEFANKTTLVINGLDGDDDIVLNNPNTPTGLTAVVVNGGNGNDTISVYTTPQPATLNGEGGDDLFRVAPSATAVITVDGGPQVIGDLLMVDTTSGSSTKNATTIQASGFQPVFFFDVERAERVSDNRQQELLKERPRF